MSQKPKHYHFVPAISVSHVRPMANLALRLLRLHPHLLVTIHVSSTLRHILPPDIAAYSFTQAEKDRLRIMAHTPPRPMPERTKQRDEDIGAFMTYLKWTVDIYRDGFLEALQGKGICDPITSRQPHPADVEQVLILDVPLTMDRELLQTIQDSFPGIGMYKLWPPHHGYQCFCHEEDSTMLRAVKEYYRLKDEEGIPALKAFSKAWDKDVLVEEHWNLGPMYTWEMNATYNIASWQSFMVAFGDNPSCLRGHIWMWPSALGPDLSKTKVQPLYVGPQLPPIVEPSSEDAATAFLNKSMRERGVRSVVYISFGSIYFPATPEQVFLTAKVLRQYGLRILISSASIPAEVKQSPEWQQWSSDSVEDVLVSDWLDQRTVLSHPALSFFITPGGCNSVCEAMYHGVPMVFWPGLLDQRTTAAQFSSQKIGIELIQARWRGIGKTTARGVTIVGTQGALEAELNEVVGTLQSKKGDEFRARVAQLKDDVRRDMESGQTSQNMVKLGDL